MLHITGAGKSTLLNVLGALDRPDAGRYRLGNDEVGELDDDAASVLRNRRIGFVFPSFHLLARLTVLENVLLPQRIGLGNRLDHRPGELSGAQLQRAAIARALYLSRRNYARSR